jgi:predicted nucleic acid-binding protein
VTGILVDSNVLIDVISHDPVWLDWSSSKLEELADAAPLVINPVIYAEISYRFSRIEDLEAALPKATLTREPISYEAAFLAGKTHLLYKSRKGQRSSPLPDFFVGAHAAIAGYSIVTRDPGRYRSYFPTVPLIAPESV